ncbi:epimerase [Deltaproteobacteria bacterium]|nr:epimerase [Deltaproteobacteria bacterium]
MNNDHLAGKNVLVTGGTGFMGRHLLPLLQAAGARVTCLTRASSRTGHLPRGVAAVRADLQSGTGLAEALEEQDVVVHLAALLFGLGWQDYLRANALAASVFAKALGRRSTGNKRPERVVLVSSLAATGPCGLDPGVTDATPPAPVSAYGWSKLMAEQTLGLALDDRLVVLRPPIIYGSGDKGLLPVFKGAAKGIAVSPGAFRTFPVSVVHAKDMAKAVLCCCAAQANGVYHVNDGARHTMAEFCISVGRALRDITGKPGTVRVLRMPLPIMAATAALSTAFGCIRVRLTDPQDRAPVWNFDKYREAKQAGWLCDSSRIQTELGWTPAVSLTEGLAETVEGYLREGFL